MQLGDRREAWLLEEKKASLLDAIRGARFTVEAELLGPCSWLE